jgi:putative nucleotidyltransferase with HDIG domain
LQLRFSPHWNKVREKAKGAFLWLSRLFEGRAPHGHLAPSDVLKSRRWPLFVFNILFSSLIAWIIVCDGPRSRVLPQLQAGEIAEQTVYSPISAEVEPLELSAKNRDELYRKVAPVFDYDDTALAIWLQNWSQAFTAVRAKLFAANSPNVSQIQLMDRVGEIIQKETGQTLISSDLLFLTRNRFSKELEAHFSEMVKPLLGRLIAEVDLFPSYYSTGIIVRQMNMGLNETLVNDVSRIWSLEHAKQLVANIASNRKTENLRHVGALVQYLVIPNLKFNPEMTDRRVNNALGRKEMPLVTVKKNQVLLRMGDRIGEHQLELIEALRAATSRTASIKRFLLVTLILSLFFLTLFYMDLTRKSFLRLSLKNGLVFAFITATTLLSIKLSLPFLQMFLTPLHVRAGGEFLMPVAAGAVLVHLLLGRELAFTFALLLAVSAAMLVERNLSFSIWVFAVCAMAVQSLGACKQRSDLYKCGAWSGLVGAVLVGAFDVYQSLGLQSFDWIAFFVHFFGAFVSGMLGSIIASTLIPVLEHILGYTTNLKLLELSNFNHPLLHNLMMKAPGTYHHSIMVGSLAEIAADRIKANPLLARVSAYYHDIGKMANPLYFIENQSPQYNPHDHLSPEISARILFSHVKNGARMGREHNLGDSINDVIQQHHGTTMATFFYNKAKEQKPSAEACVSETDYRYPGPRPQSREAAIVMIADACEASTRSIAEPTPAKIQSMVHNIINRRFLDLQFHDCDLTLKDLQVIEDCISRTLLSLYHHRIEYPGQRQDLGEATVEIPRKTQ